MNNFNMAEKSLKMGLLKNANLKTNIMSALAVLALRKQNFDDHFKYLSMALREEGKKLD